MNMQSEQVNELFSALSKAQGEMKPAIKDSKNPFFKSTYADLSSVWDACRSALEKNGLTVIQAPIVMEGNNYLQTTLGHASGQYIKSLCPLITAKTDVQSYGAAVTYTRRFALASMVGICQEDDDGEKERERHAQVKEYPKPSPEQVKELLDILENCPKEYVLSIQKGINSRGWKTFGQMDLTAFSNLVADAVKKAQIEVKE